MEALVPSNLAPGHSQRGGKSRAAIPMGALMLWWTLVCG